MCLYAPCPMRTSKADSGWKLSTVLSAPIARTCIVVCFKLPANGRAEAADARATATNTERTKLAGNCMVQSRGREQEGSRRLDGGLIHQFAVANDFIHPASWRCRDTSRNMDRQASLIPSKGCGRLAAELSSRTSRERKKITPSASRN